MDSSPDAVVNSERVILNLVQNLFRVTILRVNQDGSPVDLRKNIFEFTEWGGKEMFLTLLNPNNFCVLCLPRKSRSVFSLTG
jgi:hypothetical protein